MPTLLHADGTINTSGFNTSNTPTFTGSAAANSTVELFDGATSIGTATADANGDWSLTVAAGSELTEGAHSVKSTPHPQEGAVEKSHQH